MQAQASYGRDCVLDPTSHCFLSTGGKPGVSVTLQGALQGPALPLSQDDPCTPLNKDNNHFVAFLAFLPQGDSCSLWSLGHLLAESRFSRPSEEGRSSDQGPFIEGIRL